MLFWASGMKLVSKVTAIDDCKRSHPNSRFWIKADACDVLPGIQEFVKREWAGDVDTEDGRVQMQREEYLKAVDCIEKFGLSSRRTPTAIRDDATFLIKKLEEDNVALHKGEATVFFTSSSLCPTNI